MNPRPKALEQELLRAQRVVLIGRTDLFPSLQANTQACRSGSFMMRGAGKAYRAHVPHSSTLRIRAVGLPEGTLAN